MAGMGFFEKVELFCFAASYTVALGLELVHLFSPRPILRYVGLGFGLAGLLAQLIYLGVQPVSLFSPTGSLLSLALILTVFYIYGTVHHSRLAWGLFVLPLILALIGLAFVLRGDAGSAATDRDWTRIWGVTHGILVLLAAVGVCVGFIASLMYLVQLRRLQAKVAPGQGMKLLSLERLQAVNRRGILWAFPLLTAGLLVGIARQVELGTFGAGWDSPRIPSSLSLLGLFSLRAVLPHR